MNKFQCGHRVEAYHRGAWRDGWVSAVKGDKVFVGLRLGGGAWFKADDVRYIGGTSVGVFGANDDNR